MRHFHLRLRHADARFGDAALIDRGAGQQIVEHLLRCSQFQLGVLLLIAHRLACGQRKAALVQDLLHRFVQLVLLRLDGIHLRLGLQDVGLGHCVVEQIALCDGFRSHAPAPS